MQDFAYERAGVGNLLPVLRHCWPDVVVRPPDSSKRATEFGNCLMRNDSVGRAGGFRIDIMFKRSAKAVCEAPDFTEWMQLFSMQT